MAKRYPTTMAELVELYDAKLRSVVRSKGLASVEDDVVQEVYLYFLEHHLVESFDPTRNIAFSTYFYGYATNLVLRYYNKRKRWTSNVATEEILDWLVVDDDIEVSMSRAELEAILLYLYGLPIRGSRDLFKLFKYALLMIQDTGVLNRSRLAKQLGVSPSSVGNQLSDLADVLVSAGLVSKEDTVYEWAVRPISRS